MKNAFLLLGLLISSRSVHAVQLRNVLMVSSESAGVMDYKAAVKYCRHLVAPCEQQSSGQCADGDLGEWSLPEKEDLDRVTDKTKSSHFVWTRSRMFAVGETSTAIYRLSKGGSYAPPLGGKFHVRCVRSEKATRTLKERPSTLDLQRMT